MSGKKLPTRTPLLGGGGRLAPVHRQRSDFVWKLESIILDPASPRDRTFPPTPVAARLFEIVSLVRKLHLVDFLLAALNGRIFI